MLIVMFGIFNLALKVEKTSSSTKFWQNSDSIKTELSNLPLFIQGGLYALEWIYEIL